MRNIIKRLSALTLITAIGCGLLAGCAAGKKTVNLNEYVKVEAQGRDTFGKIDVDVDYSRMIEENQDAIRKENINNTLGDETPVLAVQLMLDQYDPIDIEYPKGENYKNGDKVDINIQINNANLSEIQKVFNVDFNVKPISYTVDGLEPVIDMEIFDDKFFIDGWGISGVDGHISPYIDKKIKSPETGYTIEIPLEYEIEDKKIYSNGDMIHFKVAMDETRLAQMARNDGIRLVSLEKDMPVNGLSYYPYETPNEVFEYMSPETDEIIQEAILDNAKQWNQDDGKPTLVGTLFMYNDPGHEYNDYYNKINQIVFIYHMDDGNVEGGYYLYTAPLLDTAIHMEQTEDGSITKVASGDNGKYANHYGGHRHVQDNNIMHSNTVPVTFEYGGLVYHGFETVEQCIEAFKANEMRDEYDHVIYDKDLQELGIN